MNKTMAKKAPADSKASKAHVTESRIFPVDNKPAHELVADQLRTSILLSRFTEGQRLPAERNLSEQLGVSRITVRKAIRILEAEKLIETLRGATGGNFVRDWSKQRDNRKGHAEITGKGLATIFEYRMAIECTAARLAALKRTKSELKAIGRHVESMTELTATQQARESHENIIQFFSDDHSFHLLIAEAARNQYLVSAVRTSRAEMFRPIGAVFGALADDANEFHREIFAAIEAGDPDAAESAMRQHIVTTYEQTLGFLGKRNRQRNDMFLQAFGATD